jgi:hypothetical protein
MILTPEGRISCSPGLDHPQLQVGVAGVEMLDRLRQVEWQEIAVGTSNQWLRTWSDWVQAIKQFAVTLQISWFNSSLLQKIQMQYTQ